MNNVPKGFISTLSTRLSLALLIIIIGVGIGVLLTSQAGMRIYYEELNQKLNSSVSMYITGEYELMQEDGAEPNREALQKLAQTAMIINPAVEVFLLDTEGKIIGHAFPEESIQQQNIPLGPLEKFINGEVQFPYRHVDPRHRDTQKVFSASKVLNNGELQGYLYVILGGELYDNIEDGLQNSYSKSLVFASISMIVVAAVIAGILIFNLLVRRLSQLSQRMQSFTNNELIHFNSALPSVNQPHFKDEIALLSHNFDSMSSQIKQQFELLREADELKRELISNVSHDLRTPLASIQGYLETLLIKNSSLSEQERLEYLNTAMKSSNRLGQLVGDLFELSTLEASQAQAKIECFSLAELVYDTVQEFNLEFDDKKISVEVRNDQNTALVYADIGLIQRVFENLIRNAIAHTPENGKVILKIEASESVVHQRLKVSIVDTGLGISAEDLPHIFERFYSNPDRSRNDVHSTGLGLAIVKRILELHSADIEVDSKIDKGTSFVFSLPSQAA